MQAVSGQLTLLFDSAKSLPVTMRAFRDPLPTEMNCHEQVVRLGSKLGLTLRTNVGFRHQYEIPAYEYQRNGNDHVVPRHVNCLRKPIYPAGSQGECQSRQKQN